MYVGVWVYKLYHYGIQEKLLCLCWYCNFIDFHWCTAYL